MMHSCCRGIKTAHRNATIVDDDHKHSCACNNISNKRKRSVCQKRMDACQFVTPNEGTLIHGKEEEDLVTTTNNNNTPSNDASALSCDNAFSKGSVLPNSFENSALKIHFFIHSSVTLLVHSIFPQLQNVCMRESVCERIFLLHLSIVSCCFGIIQGQTRRTSTHMKTTEQKHQKNTHMECTSVRHVMLDKNRQ